MLATKISFINEMAIFVTYWSLDINQVRIGIEIDKRIGYQFIYPGYVDMEVVFPKDVSKALIKIADNHGYQSELIYLLKKLTTNKKMFYSRKIVDRFGKDLSGKKFMVQLLFKPGTDDMREPPSINLIRSIVENGGEMCFYDPKANKTTQFYLKDIKVEYHSNKYDVLEKVEL